MNKYRAQYLPIRPTTSKDGLPLNYRSYPKNPNTNFAFFTGASVKAQFLLYRYSRSVDFCRCMPSTVLADVLYPGYIVRSAAMLGRTVGQAVIYEPGKAKMIAGEIQRVILIHHREDLQYGLEWMIGMWMFKWFRLKMGSTPSAAEIEEEFNVLAEIDDDVFNQRYMTVLNSEPIHEVNWRKILDEFPVEKEKFPSMDQRRKYLKMLEDANHDVLWATPPF